MAAGRPYASGSMLLKLDGTPSLVKSIEGGGPSADLADLSAGDTKLMKRTITNLKFDNLKFDIGMAMGDPILQVVNSFLKNDHLRKDMACDWYDFNRKNTQHTDYFGCLLTKFEIPACDGGTKETGFFSTEWAIEHSVTAPGDGHDAKGELNVKQKGFTPSNFKVEIGGLPCKNVTKIGAISWSASVAEHGVGEVRTQLKEVGAMKVPQFDVTVLANDAKDWDAWVKTFLIEGDCGDDKELTGSITWFDQSFKKELAVLSLDHIGVYKSTAMKSEAGKETLKTHTYGLYFETAELKIMGAK